MAQKSLYERLSKDDLERILFNELNKYEVKTPFEFSVYNNGLATKLKSDNFNYDKANSYGVPIFQDIDGNSRYQLLVTFPQKSKYVLSSIFWVVALSLLLTLIIILNDIIAFFYLFFFRHLIINSLHNTFPINIVALHCSFNSNFQWSCNHNNCITILE